MDNDTQKIALFILCIIILLIAGYCIIQYLQKNVLDSNIEFPGVLGINAYMATERIIHMWRARKLDDCCAYSRCRKPFHPGDHVIAVRGSGGHFKRYHPICYDAQQDFRTNYKGIIDGLPGPQAPLLSPEPVATP